MNRTQRIIVGDSGRVRLGTLIPSKDRPYAYDATVSETGFVELAPVTYYEFCEANGTLVDADQAAAPLDAVDSHPAADQQPSQHNHGIPGYCSGRGFNKCPAYVRPAHLTYDGDVFVNA